METKEEPTEAAAQARQLELMNPTAPLAGTSGRRGGRREEKYIDKFTPIETRPVSVAAEKKGAGGDFVNLHVNFIEVKSSSKQVILQYQVDFDPVPPSRPLKNRVLRTLSDSYNFKKEAFIFDGGSLLYTGPAGAAILGESKPGRVEIDGVNYAVNIRQVAHLDNENPQVLVLLNSQLNRFQEHELKMIRIQDNYFDPIGKLEPEGYQNRMEIWPGFETSIGIYEENKMLMSVDQRFRIIRKEDAMKCLKEAFVKAQQTRVPVDECQKIAAKAVVGQTIETSYNHLVYRVQAVDWTKSPSSGFSVRRRVGDTFEETTTTFKEYFQQRYNKVIRDAQQPLLVVRPANRALRRRGTEQILLIPELCNMTGYTDQIRQDFRLMQAVSKHTKLDPMRRKAETEKFVQKLTTHPGIQAELSHWEVKYGTELFKMRGRALRPQELFQRGKKYSYQSQNADWTTSMRGATVETAKECKLWMVLCTERDKSNAEAFANEIVSVGAPMGMNFGTPRLIPVTGDSAQAFLDAMMKAGRPDLNLVMAVFPTNAKDRYDAFKETLCCNLPCPSQVIVGKTISGAPGKIKSVATKVVIQINAKLGGDIWKMNFPFTEPKMVIGIDTHRDRVSQKTVVAIAAAWNKGFSMYYNTMTFAEDDEDVLNCIAPLIKECMEDFKVRNGLYPTGVFIYRDGISEGQLKNVKDIELVNVKNVIEACSTQRKITLTYVLVNKRESTRFFQDQGGPVVNPLSGTIVDEKITRPWRYDFYIVSQSVREGTVAPTYYNVIQDDSGLKPEHLQQMTYMLCHMYYNWPGTIRVPAPVQYARKHAQLVALNLHKKAADQLRDKLFYL